MKHYLDTTFDYNGLIDLFDELPFWSAPFGLKLLDRIVYKSGITALDIGSGTGFPLIELAMRLGPDATVHGIDPWPQVATRVAKKIAYCGITNVRLITGVAESVPLPDGSVNLITSNNGINNVKDPDAVFGECARITNPGAQFVWTMNTDQTMMEFYSVLEHALALRNMNSEIEAMYRHIAHKRPPLDRLLSQLHDRGFNITKVIHDQFRYRFSDGTAMLNHFFIRLAYLGPWKELLPANRVGEIFDEVEQRLNDSAAAAGGMQLSIPFVVIDAKRQ